MKKQNSVTIENTEQNKIKAQVKFDKNGNFIRTRNTKSATIELTNKELKTITLKQRIPKMLECAKREYGSSVHPRTHQVFIGYGKTVKRNDNKAGIVTQHRQQKYAIDTSSPYGWNTQAKNEKFCIGAKIEIENKKLKTKELIFKRIPQKRTSSKLYPLGKSNHTNKKNLSVIDTINRKRNNENRKSVKRIK